MVNDIDCPKEREQELIEALQSSETFKEFLYANQDLFNPQKDGSIPLYVIAGQHSTVAYQTLIAMGLSVARQRECLVYRRSLISDLDFKALGSYDNQQVQSTAEYKPQQCGMYLIQQFRGEYERAAMLGMVKRNAAGEAESPDCLNLCKAVVENKSAKIQITNEYKLATLRDDDYRLLINFLKALKGSDERKIILHKLFNVSEAIIIDTKLYLLSQVLTSFMVFNH